jgi:tetratricopeptide (TPR) repeat protein
VPAQLRDAIAKAMAQDPALRYPSAKDFAKALRIQGAPPVNRRRGLRAALTVAVLAVAGVGFLMLEGLVQPGGGGTVALADARISLNRGEYQVARTRFEEYLSSQPEDPEARYGLAYALLLEGDHTRAQEEFAQLGETAMREEGKAAVAYMANGEAARPALEHAADESPGGYAAVLLSMLDMMAGNFDQARQRLDGIHEDELRFDWQRRQYLQTLGQLYYKSGDYTAAQAVFDRLEQSADGAPPAFAEDYADLSRARLESATRADTGEKLARLKELMKEAPAQAGGDAWTSRALRIWIAPVDAHQGLIAQESGLADVLPWRLSRALLSGTKPAITPVERGAEADILAEQELSATLSNPDDAVRLGRVLGARLLLLSKVTRLFGKELMHVSVVDTETTLLAPVGEYEIRRDLDPDAWLGQIMKDLTQAVAKAYPLRGKVTTSPNGPVLNIGTDAGVETGIVFRMAEGAGEALVSNVSTTESTIELRNAEASAIPAEGWRVEQVQESPHAQ